LLLLHGIGSNSRAFRHQLADLSDKWTVVAWDAPGYGRSDDPLVPFTLADLADRAVSLLDELAIERAHLLGVSMGGVIAQLVYHRHPRRVQSLILADTNPGGGGLPEPERSARVQGRLEALERLGPRGMAQARAPVLLRPDAPAELLAEVTEIMAEVRPAGYRAAAIALGQTDLTPLLGEIAVPTLVIHGELDKVVPPETGRFLAENIPGAQFVLIPDAGHVANQEQPAAFNAEVREFLEDLP
jgi:pimeloyl-ACP methyl ester carboxylesterase